MKTFSATHLNKHAQEVFAAARKDGEVSIEHDRYSDCIITITCVECDVVTITMPKGPVYMHGESTIESEGDKFERVNKDAC